MNDNHLILKKKAKEVIEDRGWGQLLVHVYKELSGMIVFEQSQIENGFGIGIKDVTQLNGTIESFGKNLDATFIKARFGTTEFMIGSSNSSSDNALIISLLIDGKCSLTATYTGYELLDVDELHLSDGLDPLLRGLHENIRQRRLKEVRGEYEEKNLFYRDRFTF
jgi:hypothetical protein